MAIALCRLRACRLGAVCLQGHLLLSCPNSPRIGVRASGIMASAAAPPGEGPPMSVAILKLSAGGQCPMTVTTECGRPVGRSSTTTFPDPAFCSTLGIRW